MQHIYARKRKRRRRIRRRQKCLSIAAVIIVVTGILIFLYPFISNYLAKRYQQNVIMNQEEYIKKSEESLEGEWKKAEYYNETFENYMDALNLAGDGVMGYIEIPKIELRIPIYHGAGENSLLKGIGHVEKTALPIGGIGNHSVLTGHRGLPESELFTRLDEMEMGDRFYIYILDKVLVYEVDQITIVLPKEAGKIHPEAGRDLITLITCTPYGVNTHRLLVRGERTYITQDVEERESENTVKRNKIVFIVILLLSGTLFIAYPYLTNRLYSNKVEKQKQVFGSVVNEGDERKYQALFQELTRRNEKLFVENQKNLSGEEAYKDATINLKLYGIPNNIIGYITIPKMKVELPILLGANEENMKKGAVHLTETSYPIGGNNTNCVIAAHRGYAKAAMFREIEELEIGDKVYIENFKGKLTYKVVQLRIIAPSDISQILIREDKDMLTLITCHPYRKNSQRYVVFCERI